MRFDDVLAVLEDHPPNSPLVGLPDPRIEAAVLTALTARRSQPMFLVLPDGTVPFYNTLAAELLALPLPAEPSHIDSLRNHFQILRPDRTPMAVHERLMYRAIDAREPLTEIVVVQVGDRETPCRAAAVPFFSDDSTHVTVAIYFEPLG